MERVASLPAAPRALLEHAPDHLVIATDADLLAWHDGELTVLHPGPVDGVARHPDGALLVLVAGRVLRLCADRDPEDLTARFERAQAEAFTAALFERSQGTIEAQTLEENENDIFPVEK